jgi:hypothetical protein
LEDAKGPERTRKALRRLAGLPHCYLMSETITSCCRSAGFRNQTEPPVLATVRSYQARMATWRRTGVLPALLCDLQLAFPSPKLQTSGHGPGQPRTGRSPQLRAGVREITCQSRGVA